MPALSTNMNTEETCTNSPPTFQTVIRKLVCNCVVTRSLTLLHLRMYMYMQVIVYPGIDSRSAGGRPCQTDDNGEEKEEEGHSCTVMACHRNGRLGSKPFSAPQFLLSQACLQINSTLETRATRPTATPMPSAPATPVTSTGGQSGAITHACFF